MTLFDAIQRMDALGDQVMICAQRPWNRMSRCEFVNPDADLRVPQQVKDDGLEYFLDIASAKEALEVLGSRRPTADQRFDLLLYYAENDAFPGWVYE